MAAARSMMGESSAAGRPEVDGLSAVRAWLALVAPGILVPRAVISLGFIVAPWLTGTIHIAAVARVAATLLLLAQVSSTVVALRRPVVRSMGIFVTLLAVDFLLCGVVLGAQRQLWGVGIPLAVVALAMSFELAGWLSVGAAAGFIGVGFATAVCLGVRTPLLWPDTLMFGTRLSVETSFAGTPAVDAAVRTFPTALHVETSFGGASGLGWTAPLLLSAALVMLVALGLGVAVNVRRVRRACSASAGGSPLGRLWGLTSLGVLLLLVSVSTATAQCEPSGRAAFVEGLELLSHGDLPAATRIFFQLVDAQPACPEARNNLAVLLVEQDRLDDAATQLRKALQLNPSYKRARVNLAHVEVLLKERQKRRARLGAPAPPAPSATAVRIESAPPDVTPEETQRVEGTPIATAPAAPTATEAPEGDEWHAAISRPSATTAEWRSAVCVIQPARNRVCVYQLGGAPIAAEECYTIAVAQVRRWPRSLVASEVTARRIRLLDETGQTRLEIVPEDVQVSGDALRLRKPDWQALAAKVAPWRTAWLVVE